MSISMLLIKLNRLNVQIDIKNDKLDIKAPKGTLNDELVKEISENKISIIEYLKRFKRSNVFLNPINKTEKKDYYIATSAQKRLYVLYRQNNNNVAYNMFKLIPLNDNLRFDLIQTIFNKLIKRHDSFRTSFDLINGNVIQKIQKHVNFEIERCNIKSVDLDNDKRNLLKPFDLNNAPLLRARLISNQAGKQFLFVEIHHIISDGFTLQLLEKEFATLLHNEELKPLSLGYIDYSEWQNSKNQKERIKNQEKFWLEKFTKSWTKLELPNNNVSRKEKSFEGANINFLLNNEEFNSLLTIGKECKLTMYMTILMVFNIFLSKICGQVDIIIGTVLEGRLHSNLKSIAGMFANTVVLRNLVSPSITIRDFAETLKKQTLQSFENQEYQFDDLVDSLNVLRNLDGNPIFDIGYSFHNKEEKYNISSLNLNKHIKSISKFDLLLTAVELEESIMFNLEYSTDLFKEESINRYMLNIKDLINQVKKGLNRAISDIELISENEKRKIVFEFNNTTTDFPKDKTIPELFNIVANRNPDSIALVNNNQQLTYKEINKKSTQLANLLKSKSVKRESIVGIMMNRSNDMIIAILGVLKTGAAYLPIDINIKAKQLNYMLKDSTVELLLTDNKVVGDWYVGLQGFNANDAIITNTDRRLQITDKDNFIIPGRSLINYERYNKYVGEDEIQFYELIKYYFENKNMYLDKDLLEKIKGMNYLSEKEQTKQPVKELLVFEEIQEKLSLYDSFIKMYDEKASDTAYIIYTSGTTGNPKGTLIPHYSVNRVVLETNYITFNQNDKILQLSNYAFDGSVFDIYGALLNGGTLVICKKEDILSIENLSEIIEKERVTVFFVTTALFNTLTDYCIDKLVNVRIILFGGERISMAHAEKALKILGKDKLLHVYGPTESTVYASYHRINEIDRSKETIPIGKPLSNTKLYVFDKYLNFQPIGTTGELYVSGDGLALGYLNNPELTHDNFIKHPYEKGARIYKTGDQVALDEDCNIIFKGRLDDQVKIRGFRVELGEIESCLLKHSQINETAVVLIEEINQGKNIVAYYTGDSCLDKIDIKNYLSGNLPDYMIPSDFIYLDKLPLTTNGKINKKALPKIQISGSKDAYESLNIKESLVLKICKKILGVDNLSINDNFFSVGGDSIKAIQFVSSINNEGYKITVKDIFRYHIIKEFAKYMVELKSDSQNLVHINTELRSRKIEIQSIEKKDFYVTSQAQKGLFTYQQCNLESTAYNRFEFFPLEKDLNMDRLLMTFIKLINQHEILRTSFKLIDEEIFQVVHEDINLDIEVFNSSQSEVNEIIKKFIRPIDLLKAPLFHVGVINIDNGDKILVVDIHHLIFDGKSFNILIRDFLSILDEKKLNPLFIQYKDYSEWIESSYNKDRISKMKEFWLNKLKGWKNEVQIPADFLRSELQNSSLSEVEATLDENVYSEIDSFVSKSGGSIYIYLLACFKIFISKLSSANDIIVGTVVSGRRNLELEKVMGFIVNKIPLRTIIKEDICFEQFYGDVETSTLDSFDNHEFLVEQLFNKLDMTHDGTSHSLYRYGYIYNKLNYSADDTYKQIELNYQWNKNKNETELDLLVSKLNNRIKISFAYSSELFKNETIKQYLNYLIKLITIVLKEPKILIKDIESLSITSQEIPKEIIDIDFEL